MAEIIEVTDLFAPGPDLYANLTGAQLKKCTDIGEGVFIAESEKVIRAAIDKGYEPVSFLMERKKLSGARELLDRFTAVPVYTAGRETLCRLTGYELTRGILCAMKRKPLPPPETVLRNARRVAVLEDIADPTNLGAIFRSAAALGIDAVLVTPSCCDPLHRRAARVSMGAVFRVPWTKICASAEDWPENGLKALRSFDFRTAAFALEKDAVSLDSEALQRLPKLALIFGTEGSGLSEKTVAACDETVVIPMYHGMDSLNVAAAAAVAFWQLVPHGPSYCAAAEEQ